MFVEIRRGAPKRLTKIARPMALSAVGLVLLGSDGAFAQSIPSWTSMGPGEKGGKVILSAVGKPCLDIEAGARPHIVNRNVVDHIVSIKNGCPRSINAQICYLNSDKCSQVRLGSYERVDTIIGTAVGQTIFNYKVIQQ